MALSEGLRVVRESRHCEPQAKQSSGEGGWRVVRDIGASVANAAFLVFGRIPPSAGRAFSSNSSASLRSACGISASIPCAKSGHREVGCRIVREDRHCEPVKGVLRQRCQFGWLTQCGRFVYTVEQVVYTKKWADRATYHKNFKILKEGLT
jgi:hypothetical protein